MIKKNLQNLLVALLFALALAGAWWFSAHSYTAMQAVEAAAPDMDRTISVLP